MGKIKQQLEARINDLEYEIDHKERQLDELENELIGLKNDLDNVVEEDEINDPAQLKLF